MERRSNLMVLLGIAFFLIGGLIVVLILSDSDDNSGNGQSEATVVVAKADLAAGTLGDDLIAQDLVEVRTVEAGSQPADSLASTSQLAGTTLASSLAEGDTITFGLVTRDQLRTIEIPEGFDAVAVDFDFLSGAAGYVDPGDRLNVYAIDTECKPLTVVNGAEERVNCPYQVPRVELVLTNVLVLDVDLQIAANRGTGAPANATPDVTTPDGSVIRRPSADRVQYLLALTPRDAEKIIHQVEFERMYVSITADDAPPAGPTPGQDFTSIYTEEPNVAFDRSNPDG